jgi:hypothetical protein
LNLRFFKTEQSAAPHGLPYVYPIWGLTVAALVSAGLLSVVWVAVIWAVAGWVGALILGAPLAAGAVLALKAAHGFWGSINGIEALTRRMSQARPKSVDYGARTLGPYPLHYIKTATWRDEGGIIEVRREQGPPKRATLLIVQYALSLWDDILAVPNEDQGADFIRHAQALVDRQQRGGRLDGCWPEEHPQDYYFPHAVPYPSAMVQGQCISVLLRAHQLTGDSSFMDASHRAMGIFEVPVWEGGIRTDYPDGKVFFEEYALPPYYSHTLNGFIFTLWGLHDFARVADHPRARHWFDRAVQTLARVDVLSRYDLGYHSTYDTLPSRLISWRYHAAHIVQLRCLWEMTGLHVFRETADRWESYLSDRRARLRLCLHFLGMKAVSGAWRVQMFAGHDDTDGTEPPSA